MPNFDPRSFFIIAAVAGMLCTLIFFSLRRSCPKEIGGLSEWSWSCVLVVIGALLFIARDLLPRLAAILLPNLTLIAGVILMHFSLRRFAGDSLRHGRWAIALAAIALILFWLALIPNSYRIRIELVTLVNLALFVANGLTILRIMPRGFPEYLTAGAFFGSAGIILLRFLAALLELDSSDYQHDSTLIQHVYLATYAFALIAVSLGFMLMVSRRQQLRLEYSASHDDLTGAYTRAAFLDFVGREIGRSARHELSLSLLLVDIDNFKRINDRHGHHAGDTVIRNFVRLASSRLRDHDILCRYGGEEFAILLPGTGLDEAMVVAERIRGDFAAFALDGLPSCTVSIGLVSCRHGQGEAGALIGSADQALYAAKKSGKNKVVLAAPADGMAAQESLAFA